jgi:hypothetical protein
MEINKNCKINDRLRKFIRKCKEAPLQVFEKNPAKSEKLNSGIRYAMELVFIWQNGQVVA